MKRTLTVRKFGNIVDISPDGKSPLPSDERRILEPHLTYTYQQKLYGVDRRDPFTGIERNMRFEDRMLYRFDECGRMVCGSGMLSTLLEVLKKHEYDVEVLRKDPVRTRADCYEPDWDAVAENFQFRARQDECLAAIHDNEYGVIDAPTGFGKGIIMAMVCMLFPKAKIDIVIRRKDIVSKTSRLLSKYICNVGQIGGGGRSVGDRVTVYTADSLHHSDGDADILLCDEAHELLTPVASQELAKYIWSRNYAFTATPENRMDKADAKLESLFGRRIFSMTYEEAVALGLVVPIEVRWLDMRLEDNPCAGKKDVPKKRWGLWRNKERNQRIANAVREYQDEQVLILVETVEHAVYLGSLLPDYHLCYASLDEADLARYQREALLPLSYRPLSPRGREQLRRDFEAGTVKKVIATDVWSTGVDFVGLQVLCRADARSSEIMDVQAPGRVCRIGKKDVGILIDCLDQFDPGFHRKAMGRMRSYKAKGWEQIIDGKHRRGKGRVGKP